MSKSKPKARKAAVPAPMKQPSSGGRHPVVSFRVTPECVMLLDEMAGYYEVSKREVIDRALRELYSSEHYRTGGFGKKPTRWSGRYGQDADLAGKL